MIRFTEYVTDLSRSPPPPLGIVPIPVNLSVLARDMCSDTIMVADLPLENLIINTKGP